ncbi:MAG TPA: hypothetical protein VH375_08695 [Rhodanobacteraceae bacterium]|jgi:hypothetical protein
MPAKRFTGAIALVLLFALQTAFAVSLSPRGIGQALIYPYYTVNESQDTLISVVNASGVSKAVQVRFLEGYNGRDALTFVLYLSPHDVWTASISQTSDSGGAELRTSDASCTFPAIPAAGMPFLSSGYDGAGTEPADGGPTGITRTREGSIEFIVGADITPGSPTDIAITHVQAGNPGAGVPPGCATLTSTSALPDEVAPVGGIYGSGSIVDVGVGTFFAYNADAIQGFTSIPLFNSAADQIVSLEDANSSEAVQGTATAYVPDEGGAPFALDYAFGIDAVSAVFMADTFYNEYIIAASLGANTDWVITFPTKRFYVDPIYGAVPIPPFSFAFTAPGTAEVDVSGSQFNREEEVVGVFGGPCSLCPPVSPPPNLPYEVNVIAFINELAPGTPSGVFGSRLTNLFIPHATNGDEGNVVLEFTRDPTQPLPFASLDGGLDTQGTAVGLEGMPATGFMAYNVINSNAEPGLLANYSGVFAHRATSACSGGSAGESCSAAITGALASRPRSGAVARSNHRGEGK